MLNWIRTKLRSVRIAATIIQLESDLQTLSKNDIAYVVVCAIEFCLAFRNSSNEGVFVSMAMEEPDRLSPADASQLYHMLEDILLTGERRNKDFILQAKQRHGSTIHKDLDGKLRLSTNSIRLVMARLSCVFTTPNAKRINRISAYLRSASPLIDSTVKLVISEQAAIGREKSPGYYEHARNSAFVYATTYPILVPK